MYNDVIRFVIVFDDNLLSGIFLGFILFWLWNNRFLVYLYFIGIFFVFFDSFFIGFVFFKMVDYKDFFFFIREDIMRVIFSILKE